MVIPSIRMGGVRNVFEVGSVTSSVRVFLGRRRCRNPELEDQENQILGEGKVDWVVDLSLLWNNLEEISRTTLTLFIM